MKMVYERPMMTAEEHITNAFCAPCRNPVIVGGSVSLAGIDDSRWFDIENGFSTGVGNNPLFADTDYYQGLGIEFDQSDRRASGNENPLYYWTATGKDGNTYYMEYSAHWSAGNKDNTGVFILYQEDGASGSANAGALDSSEKPWQSSGGQSGTLDTPIAALYFEDNSPIVNS